MKIDHYCWIKNVFKNTCLTNLSISDKTTNIIIEIKHCFELSYVMISFHNLCSPLSKCHPFKALQKNWDKNLINRPGHNLCSPLSKCHPFKALQKNWDKNLINRPGLLMHTKCQLWATSLDISDSSFNFNNNPDQDLSTDSNLAQKISITF